MPSTFYTVQVAPVVDLEEILKLLYWQEDSLVSEDFSIMQTPGETFDGKCDRWNKKWEFFVLLNWKIYTIFLKI